MTDKIGTNKNEPEYCFHHTASPRRLAVEQFLRNRFYASYQAEVAHFMPNLIGVWRDQVVRACVGFRNAANQSLYLEQYLANPVEKVLSEMLGQRISRSNVVEVGNLASVSKGTARTIILLLTKHLFQQNLTHVVFTATPCLLGIFSALDLKPIYLTEANPAKLSDDETNWGSYYESQPVVVGGDIRYGYEKLMQSPLISRALENLPNLQDDSQAADTVIAHG